MRQPQSPASLSKVLLTREPAAAAPPFETPPTAPDPSSDTRSMRSPPTLVSMMLALATTITFAVSVKELMEQSLYGPLIDCQIVPMHYSLLEQFRSNQRYHNGTNKDESNLCTGLVECCDFFIHPTDTATTSIDSKYICCPFFLFSCLLPSPPMTPFVLQTQHSEDNECTYAFRLSLLSWLRFL